MLKPRNTLVVVAEIKEGEKKTDTGLVIPQATGQEYKLAEVIDVGPGMITQADEVSPCQDLVPGQTVLVKLQHQQRINREYVGLQPLGVDFKTEDGRDLKLVEQSQIVGIVAEAGETPKLATA